MSETKPRVVLVGAPGSGKTTIGRRLSHALHVQVVDSDELIAEKYGKPCGDVLRELGEEEFRNVEERAVAEALTTPGVVSLGGGAVLREPTRHKLMNQRVVYLHVSVEEGVRRIQGNSSRPLLDVPDPEAKYQQILQNRHQFYEEVASFRVRSGNSDPQRVVTAVLQYLEDSDEE